FSSLGYLHAFQIDELKIDRSFVPGGGGIGDAHVLSQAIVDLGRALSLDMIAEGIETRDQAEWFRLLGCRSGQGFLFSRPVPASEMDKYLREQAGLSRSARLVPSVDPSPVALGGARLAGTGTGAGTGITDVLGGRKAAG